MKNLKIGLKMFSNKLNKYEQDIIKLYAKGSFTYIELYVYPGNMEHLESWEKFKEIHDIPFTIHAPHFSQGANLADKSNFEHNKLIYKQVNTFARALDAEYMVVHSGMDGTIEEVVRQLDIIKPYKMAIENKPYVAPRKPKEMVCRGATVEEIKYVREHHPCGFCLDVGHAFCAATSLGIDKFEFLKKFNELKPTCYHLSDGEFDNPIDIHLHLSKGDYNWEKVFEIIDISKNMTVETLTKNFPDVKEFYEDFKFLQG